MVPDDTVQFKAGLPERLYLSALSTTLDRLGDDAFSNDLGCHSRRF